MNLVEEHFETEEFEVLPEVDDDSMSERSEQTNNLQHSKPTSCMSLEGVTIGATYMKKPYACVMAISGGQLIRPLPLIRITKSDHLAKVGTKFKFTKDVERIKKHLKLPHSYEDVQEGTAR